MDAALKKAEDLKLRTTVYFYGFLQLPLSLILLLGGLEWTRVGSNFQYATKSAQVKSITKHLLLCLEIATTGRWLVFVVHSMRFMSRKLDAGGE